MTTKVKDPDARLDYDVDWDRADEFSEPGTGWLPDGDSITESTWEVTPAGLTHDTPSIAGARTTVWLDGGTAGQDYTVTNHITTSQGRETDRSFVIAVRER